MIENGQIRSPRRGKRITRPGSRSRHPADDAYRLSPTVCSLTSDVTSRRGPVERNRIVNSYILESPHCAEDLFEQSESTKMVSRWTPEAASMQEVLQRQRSVTDPQSMGLRMVSGQEGRRLGLETAARAQMRSLSYNAQRIAIAMILRRRRSPAIIRARRHAYF
jgi:hypothetical protein